MKQTCKNCSKDFEAQRSTAQFCSDLCRVTFNRKKAPIITDAPIEFIPTRTRFYMDYLKEARTTKEPEQLMREAVADKKLTPAQRDMIRSKLKPQI